MRIRTLLKCEREATAELIAHLGEMDTRDLHLREGYASLYLYCRDALGLSEWEAYNRIEVARTAREFPLILEMLASGAVHLTTIRLLSPHLTAANHREVLESARGRKKTEVLAIVARLSSRPDVTLSVRRIPTPSPPAPAPPQVASGPEPPCIISAGKIPAAGPGVHASPAVHGSAVSREDATPLSPDRYKLQLTISGDTLEKLRLAQDMLSHAVPPGDAAVVIDRALSVLLAELARARFAHTSEPRDRVKATAARATAARAAAAPNRAVRKREPRRVPAAVKRAVWVRDLGRCAFVGRHGRRCDERRFIEFHHVDPYALGGQATVDGIQLRCRSHNDYEGRVYFGTRRRLELVPEQVRLSASSSRREENGSAAEGAGG